MRRFLAVLLCSCTGGPIEDEPTDTTTDTSPPLAAVTVDAAPAPTCVDPAARLEQPYDIRYAYPTLASEAYFWGGGVVISDVDVDGRPDVLILREGDVDRYDQTEIGGFERTKLSDETAQAFGRVFGGLAVDDDADGDPDLVVTEWGGRARRFRNDGGVFSEASNLSGFPVDQRHFASASAADFDGDGDLDLFLAGHGLVDETAGSEGELLEPDPSSLLLGNGDGTYEDASLLLPEELQGGYTFVGGWTDADRDGDPDLYVINDFGRGYRAGRLFWNEAGSLVAAAYDAGTNLPVAGMGLAIADLNGDLIPDYAVPAWGRTALHLSAGPGLWFESADALGLVPDPDIRQTVGWGGQFLDVDLDGDEDLPLVYGFLETNLGENEPRQPDGLWLQQPNGQFADAGPAFLFDRTDNGRGYAGGDVNLDGVPDVVISNLAGPPAMYLSRCSSFGWLRVRLQQDGPNRDAIGAEIRAYTGDVRRVRWIMSGGTSLASSGPPEAMFGFGSAQTVDRLEITWPDGAESVVEGVAAGRALTVRRDPTP